MYVHTYSVYIMNIFIVHYTSLFTTPDLRDLYVVLSV